ncbi:type II secretion system F family protein [Marinobacter sp. ANT_B65]|uniref:type II secretion system F family protein n=1 Tax=Marinobacter sp. ANT_B65 TaxID=2039467 RepID=UPI000BBE529E|nr:type II secretion system F family protein [Marinobacter sp. ANT_B65]PCM44263.1 type II secretion system protein [Marinobacter sp. ANT_B65]
MTAQLVWMGSLVAGMAALLLMLGQLFAGQALAEARVRKQIRQRLQPAAARDKGLAPAVANLGGMEGILMRAGINPKSSKTLVFALIVIFLILGLGFSRGWIEAGVAAFSVVTASVTLWRMRFERQRRQIFEELPGILDGLLRSISVGRSAEQSIVTSFSDGSPVFDPLVRRLKSAVSQGRDYTLVLDGFAKLYQIPPLTQLAIAFRTSSRFGSSIRPVLQEVAKAIRSQQELRREFLAETAETRFTAVVFAIMPPGLGVYMVVINEQFSDKLLETDAGHTLLYISGGLQLFGILLILKLISGVGRG